MKTFPHITFIAFALSLVACKQSSVTEESKTGAHPVNFSSSSQFIQKPGSPFAFANNYDGQTDVNEPEQFNVLIRSTASGSAHIKITAAEIILPNGNIEASYPVESGQTLTVPVTVQPLEEGKFYLNIQAQIESEGKIQAGANAIAIRTESNKGKVKSSSERTTTKNSNVVILPANETVE